MKTLLLTTFLLGILVSYSGAAQNRNMSVYGEKVWVIVNTVKAEKRPQFEDFLHNIFWPGAAKLDVQDQKVFAQTRILHPVAAEPDGSYSYLFIMDPVIDGGNYDIESLLTKMFGKAKAQEYFKTFEDALAGKQKEYLMIQSKH